MDRAELRAALSRRLRWLWRTLAIPGVRMGLRWLWRLSLVAYFFFIVLILALRYWLLPSVASYQTQIETAATQAIGLPVKIRQIDANWEGLNPRLTLTGVSLADRQGKPALAFDRVESILSWHTLWRMKPILSLLAIEGPVLHVRRDTAGRITIAGVTAEGEADPRVAEWFFEQRRIRIRNAIIVWEDARRQAPPLILEDLQFGLDNRGDRHRFGLSAVPPAQLASRLDIRGDLRGNLMESFDRVSGKVFAELDYADLAGWRAWVDYPIRMTQGRGALRVWGNWDEGKGGVTADVALEDVRVQLGRNVPQLELASMRGRISGNYQPDAWHFAGQKIELSTLAGGIRVPPTDFNVEWRQTRGDRLSGSATANFLDLEALQRLAAYLPLDARSRELLATHQPQGRITDLRASWDAEGDQLKNYGLHARFDGMGMRAAGYFPGGAALSGEVEATEKGGKLTFDSRGASVDLPSIFPESRVPLNELRASAVWTIDGKKIDARLEQIEFASPDAAGSARGSYRYDGDGPGVIDLTATLSRADGQAVWRYMPHVVNIDARQWLRRGIVSGTASDARLTLKGDLRHFPFADKSKGEFLITAKARDVRLDYAPGWPAIEGVDANLSFGVGMRVEATRGRIFGTQITNAVAEIPSFGAEDEKLLVNGQVEGPTTEFLRFIDKSPVADNINRMTDDMRAAGNGKLALKLDIPLRHALDTRVQGEYQFTNNQITAVAGLPAVQQVNGRIAFTERSVTAPEITGQVFGAPMRMTVRNDGDKVMIALSGGAVARELRKVFDTPLFDHLSGQTTWKGEVRVRKRTTEFAIDSNLVGIASTLPEPFGKAAATALPLRFEKSTLPGGGRDSVARDQLHVVLRGIAEAQLQRRDEGHAMVIERGAAAIGTALPEMPAKGVTMAARMQRVDGDFWRRHLTSPSSPASAPAAAAASPVFRIGLKTPSLRLLGRDFNEVDIDAVHGEQAWQIGLNAKEAEGRLTWQTSGKGLVRADLKRLLIPSEQAESARPPSDGGDDLDALPGLDVQVAELSLGNKRLGRLEAKAHNTHGIWHLDSLSLQNADGGFKGKGEWQSRQGHQTHLDFELTASDIGKFLGRLGYPGAVRGGMANLKGDLSWAGPLTSIHYPSLTGEFRLHAEKGQFSKLDPGIGKLLGLLSLQSLPRRLTLDFRDIFSDGFAFDSINAKLAVKSGVMRTAEDLRIDGPSARILMKGEADLKAETQDVLVTVQPEVGAVVGIGAVALAHPIAGAIAMVANKILQNPLNKVFAFQYRVSGGWADPKVEKVGQTTTQLPPIAPTPVPRAGEPK